MPKGWRLRTRCDSNAVKVVCSTSALGMGFDKPDLSFVIHFQSPGSPVSYYQQVGRAGRAIEHATGVLLAGEEDQNIWDYFLQTSLPVQAQANEVVDALAREADWMTIGDLEAVVNLRRSRLEGLLKVLEVEGAVEKERSRYRRTLARWTFDEERFARVRALREAEQAAMREYAGTRACRMRFLQGQLDDDNAVDCGRCDNCLGRPLTADRHCCGVVRGVTIPAQCRSGHRTPQGGGCPRLPRRAGGCPVHVV